MSELAESIGLAALALVLAIVAISARLANLVRAYEERTRVLAELARALHTLSLTRIAGR